MSKNDRNDPFSIEKEKLELTDKRVEIQRKRLEIKREKFNMEEAVSRRNIDLEHQRLQLEKISELRNILCESIIDSEATIIGTEQSYIPLVTGVLRTEISKKLLELIRRI